MVDTRAKLKAKKLEELSLLFQEICQLRSVILIDKLLKSIDHPFSFQNIKRKIDDSGYQNVQELADDMRKITSHINDSCAEGDLFDTAIGLESYIEMTIDPIVHANGLLQLYQTKSEERVEGSPKLDEENVLSSDQDRIFRFNYSSEDQLKFLLRWPLPTITKDHPGYREYEDENISEDENEKIEALELLTTEETFSVEDMQYKIGGVSFLQMLKYSIHISKSNHMDRIKFVSEYVDKFLKSEAWNRSHRVSLYNSQTNRERLRGGVDNLLYYPLNRIIELLVESSFESHKQHFLKLREVNVIESPYSIVTNSALGLSFDYVEIEIHFVEVESIGFLGLNIVPSMIFGCFKLYENCGYKYQPDFLSGLGWIKYITFELESCIELLQSDKLWNENREYTEEEQVIRNRLKELEDALFKHTTVCVHLGVSRFMLTDCNGFLLVKLKFEQEQVPLTYGTSLSHPAQYIKSEYYYFSHDEPYIRLYIATFFAMNQELIDEIAEFRSLISKKYKEVKSFTIKEQDEAIAKDEATKELDVDESKICGLKPEPLKFDKTLFKRVSYVELGDMIIEIIRNNARVSQVVMIDSMKFAKAILPQNMILQGPLPPKGLLKVYDIFVGYKNYSYQDCINRAVREAMVLCLLSECDFAPRLYSYGRLADLRPRVGDLYLRLSGGYIMTEFLEGKAYFPKTEEFFKSQILPLFQKMHSKDIILDVLDVERAIVTKEGHFKITDFTHAKFTKDPKWKKKEIDKVYKRFGYRSPSPVSDNE